MAKRPSIDGLDRNGDAIAGTALGDDDPRLGGIALELAPQTQNLNVDRTVVNLVVVTATHLDQLVSRHHAVGGGEQGREQVELAVAERHLGAVLARESPGAQVQLPARDPVSATD